jgi:hypothetical protein
MVIKAYFSYYAIVAGGIYTTRFIYISTNLSGGE